MKHILNAHTLLSLTAPKQFGTNNIQIYTDPKSGKTYHELVNAHYTQFMPTLEKISNFTEDQLNEALSIVNGTEDSVRYKGYSECWRDGLPRCTAQLLTDKNTRRAVIHFIDTFPQPSCLMSIQFLVRNNQLDLIANFRSWELELFAKYDICLLLEMAKEMSRHLGNTPLGNLYINAGSAHIMVSN